MEGGWGGVRGGAPWPGCGAEPREKKSLIRAQLALKTVKFRSQHGLGGVDGATTKKLTSSCFLELGMEGGGGQSVRTNAAHEQNQKPCSSSSSGRRPCY